MLFDFIEKRILFLLFVFAILIDAVNGYTQLSLHRETSIGVFFRGSIWLFLLIYISQNLLVLKRLTIVLFVITACLIYWCLAYDAVASSELNNLVRTSYVFVLFSYFCVNKQLLDKLILYKYVMIYGCLMASVIIVCFVLGIGYSSYGNEENKFGWGTTGLFIAQNDLSLTFVCSLLLSCIYYNKCKTTIAFMGLFLIAIGAVLIGTRVCFFFIPLILFIESLFIFKQKGHYAHKMILSINIAFMIPIIAFLIYLALDDYALAKLTIESIGNARAGLIDYGKEYMKTLNGFSFLIGKGVGNYQYYVAKKFMSPDNFREVEADFFDVICPYGFLLGLVVLLFYLYFIYKAILLFFYRKNSETLFLTLLFVFYVLIGYLAGHAATNVMAAPLYALSANTILNFVEEEKIVIIEYKNND